MQKTGSIRWLTIAALLSCSEGVDPDPPGPSPAGPPRWKAFTVAELQQQRAAQNLVFLEFLSESSVRAGLFHLPAGAVDGQDTHNQDEVYYIVNGVATITVEGVDHPVEAGSVVFVKANVSHRFHSITEDLDVIVVFAAGPPDPTDPAGRSFDASDLTPSRDAGRNVWNQFLEVSTMRVGLYMLPQTVGGDTELTHTFDELNVVVDGRARFAVGEDTIDLAPGTVVFVESGVGHRFHSLEGDTDVLIWWER